MYAASKWIVPELLAALLVAMAGFVVPHRRRITPRRFHRVLALPEAAFSQQ